MNAKPGQEDHEGTAKRNASAVPWSEVDEKSVCIVDHVARYGEMLNIQLNIEACMRVREIFIHCFFRLWRGLVSLEHVNGLHEWFELFRDDLAACIS